MNIVMRDPAKLKIHPLRKHFPKPDTKMPEYVALNESVRAGGVLQPILVIVSGEMAEIVDGVWRWQAAKDWGFKEIPCIAVNPNAAGWIIAESLICRKQMTRGATAYLMMPIVKEVVQSANLRCIDNLRNSRNSGETELKTQCFSNPSNLDSVTVESIKTLCVRWGMSDETFRKARLVWLWLNESEPTALRKLHAEFGLAVPATAELKQLQEDLRSDFEPQLLNGEKNLWNVESGIKGRLKGGAHEPTHQQLHLFGDALDSLAVRAERFDSPNKAAAEVKEWLVNLEKNMSGVGKTTEEYREKITRIADATKVAHDAIVARLRELEREAKAK